MFKQYTTRFWAWLYAHARAPKPWIRELETFRTWFLNTFDPLAKRASGRDKVTDYQWNNLTLKRAGELRAQRARNNRSDWAIFQRSRDWSGEVSRADLNSKKRWR